MNAIKSFIIKSFHALFSIMLLFMAACNEYEHSPVSKDGKAPPPVSHPVAESLPGAAKISYQVPADKNFLYVRAQAEIRKGVFREAKASYYANTLVIDGFGDTREYTVNLYSVGRNGQESAPVSVTVTPHIPPIYSIYESIINSVQETFGGIRFTVENPSKADVRIYVNTPDSLGIPVNAEIFYTSAMKNTFSVRGFDTTPRPFSIYVQDRWGNTSDTYVNVFQPWYEVRLDKTKHRGIQLPGDNTNNIYSGRPVTNLWDEQYSDSRAFNINPGTKAMPISFTMDLGVKVALSRVIVHGRVNSSNTYLYNGGMPKEWEIFGAMEYDVDGSWDNWVPLRAPCESYKPSGLELGTANNEDYQRQVDGEEFEFDIDIPHVRYLRWNVTKVWGGPSITFFIIAEATFFGNVIETYR